METQVVILAAGKGKRMYSKLPKVMHHLAGRPLLEHVIRTVLTLSTRKPPIVVYGHGGQILQEKLSQYPVTWVEQPEQLGTAHAVLQALSNIDDNDKVLILYGDVPLISATTLKKLIVTTSPNEMSMLTIQLTDPGGYGRIKRNHENKIISIIEEKDANPDELEIKEVNPGIYFVLAKHLKKWIPNIKNNNNSGEYYLTDIIRMAAQENIIIHEIQPKCLEEVLGVNERGQLAHLERFYQLQTAKKLMQQGVTLSDPNRLDIRGDIQIGKDVTIDVNVIMEGNVIIGNECIIGPNTILRNVNISDKVEIRANSIIDGADIASDCVIGPFSRIRPGTKLAQKVHLGNFVEVKMSQVGEETKINHLTYIGDSEIGKKVNIGAGTITCNYDGVNKHKTIIGDNAFIGSCTQLIAPVMIGKGATIGAGSTITRDAPPNQLTLARVEQRSIETWQRPEKQEIE